MGCLAWALRIAAQAMDTRSTGYNSCGTPTALPGPCVFPVGSLAVIAAQSIPDKKKTI